jgi:two-component system sensor histidine kinase MprB
MRFTLTLRRKFVIAFAAVAVLVAALVGFISFSVTRHGLDEEINRSLISAATTLAAGGTVSITTPATQGPPGGGGRRGGQNDGIIQAAQTVHPDGSVTVIVGAQIPVDPQTAQLTSAAGGVDVFRTVDLNGHRYRVLSQALGPGQGVIEVARDLNDTDGVLTSLAWTTFWVGLGVAAAAAAVGWLAARQITRRLETLTEAAEQVSSTGHLDVDIPTSGRDEVTRLGRSMQAMLADLARSRDDQQRLVQDAGHELRTPLTSLRTNVSVLRRFDELSPRSRQRLLDDVEGESRELTDLVNELVQLATDSRDAEEFEPVDLGAVAERVAALFRRRAARDIIVDAETVIVLGRPHALERAISNLVDNAVKFDADGTAPIEIVVRGTTVTVSDRGPGLTGSEQNRIFDRFYRATEARSLPGSGLGLSIVQDVATGHGGAVIARNRPGGGAVIGFTLPGSDVESNPQLNSSGS